MLKRSSSEPVNCFNFVLIRAIISKKSLDSLNFFLLEFLLFDCDFRLESALDLLLFRVMKSFWLSDFDLFNVILAS